MRHSNLINLKVEKKTDTARTGKYSIRGVEFQFPSYIPELKGEEDWKVFMNHPDLLPKNSPIILPSGHWASLVTSIPLPTLDYDISVAKAIRDHHLIFFEPPEIYSYKLPQILLRHSFHGSDSTGRLFRKYVSESRYGNALGLLPPFERKFVEAAWDYILALEKRKKNNPITLPKDVPTSEYRRNFEKLWLTVDKEYISKIQGMMYEAPKQGSASFIPPVPVLKSSSNSELVSQVVRMNRAAAFLAAQSFESSTGEQFTKPNVALPWLSLYLDSSCFEIGAENSGKVGLDTIYRIVQNSFDTKSHVGISLVINGIERLKSVPTKKNRLISLIESLDEFAISRGIPILLPRSGYFGFELIDYGVEFFSSMLSGAFKYSSGGRDLDPSDKYGKTVVYRVGELSLAELNTYLTRNGELPTVSTLPSKPTVEQMNDATKFRVTFSKPRRIATHIREMSEISEAISKGTIKPATQYLTGMISEEGKNYLA